MTCRENNIMILFFSSTIRRLEWCESPERSENKVPIVYIWSSTSVYQNSKLNCTVITSFLAQLTEKVRKGNNLSVLFIKEIKTWKMFCFHFIPLWNQFYFFGPYCSQTFANIRSLYPAQYLQLAISLASYSSTAPPPPSKNWQQ